MAGTMVTAAPLQVRRQNIDVTHNTGQRQWHPLCILYKFNNKCIGAEPGPHSTSSASLHIPTVRLLVLKRRFSA